LIGWALGTAISVRLRSTVNIPGYLVDKMGHYKPVMVLTLVLNAAFHHALLLIPPMETPGITPPAYVMRDPASGRVGVSLDFESF